FAFDYLSSAPWWWWWWKALLLDLCLEIHHGHRFRSRRFRPRLLLLAAVHACCLCTSLPRWTITRPRRLPPWRRPHRGTGRRLPRRRHDLGARKDCLGHRPDAIDPPHHRAGLRP